MTEPTKTITAMELTNALSDYFIERNMGMPGPSQERMAADIWFRLPNRDADWERRVIEAARAWAEARDAYDSAAAAVIDVSGGGFPEEGPEFDAARAAFKRSNEAGEHLRAVVNAAPEPVT